MKLKEQSGQMIVEAVLIMTMLMGFAYFISSAIRGNEIFSRLVSGPWTNLSGVIQNGVWAPPNTGVKLHPANFDRRISLKGDDPK